MIPLRFYADLPEDVAWVITERWIPEEERRRLIVYLARDIPPDSPLEQVYVRQAVKAWRHRNRGSLSLLPIFAAGGAGLGWLIKQFRRPAAVAGTAAVTVAGVALAVTLTDLPRHPTSHHPPAAEAPPSMSPPRTPGRPAAQPKPKPSKATQAPAQPSEDTAAAPATAVKVTHRLPSVAGVHVPKVPPVRVPRPPVTVPPVTTPPAKPVGCRLVQVEVGRLVRVCL